MAEKKTFCLSLIQILLIVSTTLVSTPLLIANVTLVSIPPVHADSTTIVYTVNITVPAPSVNFTIDVNITDVTDMGGFGFLLDYDPYVLEAIRVYPTNITQDATKWLPVDENGTFHWDAWPTIDNTIGRVFIAAWGFTPFTGSGTVFRINFTAEAEGNSTLDLFYRAKVGEEAGTPIYEIYPDSVEVLDSWADPINNNAIDGSVTVLPELPTFIVTPLLLVTSLAAAFLGTLWSRRRKDAPIAE
jgi:hypothetical protein